MRIPPGDRDRRNSVMAINQTTPASNAGTEVSRSESMLEALKSGQAKFTLDSSDSEPEPVESETEADSEPLEQDSSSEITEEAEETVEESSEETESENSSPEISADSANKKTDIEEILVKGPNGRQKLKIDYSDKDKIKNAYKLAAGARLWQSQRDSALKQKAEVEKKAKELEADFNKLEAAYSEGGVKGLVNLLEKRDDAYDDFLEQEIEARRKYDALPPERKELEDFRRQAEKEKLDALKQRSDVQKQLDQIKKEREAAELKEMQSKFNPSFDRYRFAGSLGDDVAEADLDEMLWNKAIANLEKVPDGIELTQAMIDKEFRLVSQRLKKHIHVQATKQVKSKLDNTKKVAASKAQAVAKRGISKSSALEEVQNEIKSGDMSSALMGFFKRGGKV